MGSISHEGEWRISNPSKSSIIISPCKHVLNSILHSSVLKLMGKGVTAAQNIVLLRLCRQYGIKVGWTVLSGFPGEQDRWYAEYQRDK